MSPNVSQQGQGAHSPDALTRIGHFLTIVVVSALALWLLYRIRTVLLILIAGMTIAYALAPVVKAFSGNRPQLRVLGIVTAYVAVFLGLTLGIVLGFRPVAEDARTLSTTLPDAVQQLDKWLADTTASFRAVLPPQLQRQGQPSAGSMIAQQVQSVVSNLGRYVGSIAALGQSFATLATGGILALIIGAFILADPTYFRRQLFAVIPVAVRADAEILIDEIDHVLVAFILGSFVVAIATGLTATVAMLMMGVKYAVILGLFTAVTQPIPQVGGAIALVAAVGLTSLQSLPLALGVLVLYLVLYQIFGNVLGPMIVGRTIQLSPLVIILVTMVGTVLGGVVGLVLSVPVAAVLKVVWNFFYPRLASRWGLAAPRDRPASPTP